MGAGRPEIVAGEELGYGGQEEDTKELSRGRWRSHHPSGLRVDITNFDRRLPTPHAQLAIETLKDPYVFDFLGRCSITPA